MRDRVLEVRRTRIGAALGATGVVGVAFEPFQSVFLDALAELTVLSSGGALDRLGVETVVAWSRVPEWLDILQQTYGMRIDNCVMTETLGLALGKDTVAVGLTEARATSVPEVRFAFLGDWASNRVAEALRSSGVSAASLDAADTLLGRLRLRAIDRVEVAFTRPDAEPVFRIGTRHRFAATDHADVQGRLDLALDGLGVSAGQRAWIGATVKAFGARADNRVDLVATLDRQRLHPELDIGWHQVSLRLALKILVQFGPRDVAMRLGALAAAGDVGDDDLVDRFHIRSWNGEPPSAALEIFLGREVV